MKTLLCLIVLAAMGFAADLSGKWTGNFNQVAPDGSVNEGSALLVLKQTGTEISGTAGPSEDQQFPISKGKIDGDKVTLEVKHESGMTIAFNLVLADERLKGEASMSRDGESRTAKVDVGRAK
jgi:hypothetical protein